MPSDVAAPDSRPLGERMIFVVGARRSGTNWLGRLIATHPDVAAVTSESFLFHSLGELTTRFQHGSKGSWQLATVYLERDVLIDGLRSFCDTIFGSILENSGGPATRLLERTPDHWRHLGLIGEIYPDAHIVHIIRDGRDVARSLVSMEWGPGTLTEAAQEWSDSVVEARRQSEHLRHYTEVRYEELLASPREGITDLLVALGLTVTPGLVDAVLTESEVPYNHDPAMPAVGAQKWATALSPSELAEVEAVAGPTLQALGFELANPGPPAKPGVAATVRSAAAHAVDAARWRLRDRSDEGRAPAGDINAQQAALDEFLGHVRSGRTDDALKMVDDRARVRLVRGDDEWEARGDEARERLVATLMDDPAVRSGRSRSDVWPSSPAFTVVFAAAEDHLPRTLVAYLSDGRLAQAAFYAPG